MAKKLTFSPRILQTKEELRLALKEGQIKSSKYNALDEDQKLFVELICFGGYKAGPAMKVIKPHIKDPYAAGHRMMHNDNVVEAIEELAFKRDKMWLAQVSSSRDMALNVMEYIMKTTDDDNLKVATAKAIVDAADKAYKQNTKKDDGQVTGISFNFHMPAPDPTAESIIQESDDDEVIEIVDMEKQKETGLPYSLNYVEMVKGSYQNKEDE